MNIGNVIERNDQDKLIASAREIYDGKLTFCYAACLSMLLKNKGFNLSIPYLENIITMCYGFFYIPSSKYFDMYLGGPSPHIGLQFAGKTLGFEVTQKNFDTFDEAREYLDAILKETPVIIGPVNLGTMPNHLFRNIPPGADHYIVALTKLNDSEYLINDPEGYIEIPITAQELDRIWEGKEIDYTDAKYILTFLGEKTHDPSREDIFKNVLKQILQNLENQTNGKNFFMGSNTIDKFLEDYHAGKYQNVIKILSGFQLEMSNQRCYVSAEFLKDYIDIHLDLHKASLLRYQQAKLFGWARILAIKEKEEELIIVLKDVSELEKEFHRILQKIFEEI